MSRPERLADLLPGEVADLARRHTTTNGAAMTVTTVNLPGRTGEVAA